MLGRGEGVCVPSVCKSDLQDMSSHSWSSYSQILLLRNTAPIISSN